MKVHELMEAKKEVKLETKIRRVLNQATEDHKLLGPSVELRRRGELVPFFGAEHTSAPVTYSKLGSSGELPALGMMYYDVTVRSPNAARVDVSVLDDDDEDDVMSIAAQRNAEKMKNGNEFDDNFRVLARALQSANLGFYGVIARTEDKMGKRYTADEIILADDFVKQSHYPVRGKIRFLFKLEGNVHPRWGSLDRMKPSDLRNGLEKMVKELVKAENDRKFEVTKKVYDGVYVGALNPNHTYPTKSGDHVYVIYKSATVEVERKKLTDLMKKITNHPDFAALEGLDPKKYAVTVRLKEFEWDKYYGPMLDLNGEHVLLQVMYKT